MVYELPELSVLELSTFKSPEETALFRHLADEDIQKAPQHIFCCPNIESLKVHEVIQMKRPFVQLRVLDTEGELSPHFSTLKFDLIIVSGPLSEKALDLLRVLQRPEGILCHTKGLPETKFSDEYDIEIIPYRTTSNGVHHQVENVIIIETAVPSPESHEFATELVEQLESCGFSTQRVSWSQNLEDLTGKRCIVLLELTSSFFENLSKGDFDQFKRITLGSRDILWVTSLDGPLSSIVTGLSRTIRSELVGLRFRTVHAKSSMLCQQKKYSELVVRAFRATGEESEFGLVNGRLEICRLHEARTINRDLQRIADGETVSVPLENSVHPLKLGVGSPGMLDTLRFEVDVSLEAEIGDEEVELEVKASGVK